MTSNDILCSFLARVIEEIGEGRMGALTRGVVFLRNEKGAEAIVLTCPIESEEKTKAELRAALAWIDGPPEADFNIVLGSIQ